MQVKGLGFFLFFDAWPDFVWLEACFGLQVELTSFCVIWFRTGEGFCLFEVGWRQLCMFLLIQF